MKGFKMDYYNQRNGDDQGSLFEQHNLNIRGESVKQEEIGPGTNESSSRSSYTLCSMIIHKQMQISCWW